MRTAIFVVVFLLVLLLEATARPAVRCKSSKDGQWVSQHYAKKHPNTTQCSPIRRNG